MPEKFSGPDDGRQGVVLLVEDDPDVAAFTGLVLRRLAGARVLAAASAGAALATLAAEDVDVVVTDIDLLPGADGLELTALVRERYPLLPVVVLSGHGPPGRAPGRAGRRAQGRYGRIRHAKPPEIVRDTTERAY